MSPSENVVVAEHSISAEYSISDDNTSTSTAISPTNLDQQQLQFIPTITIYTIGD